MQAFQVDLVYFAMRHLHQQFEQAQTMPAKTTWKMIMHYHAERAMWTEMITKALPGKKRKTMRDLLAEMPDPTEGWIK